MWVSNTQQFMNHDVVHEHTKDGERKFEVIKPSDQLGVWNVRIDDNSFEPVSKEAKLEAFLKYTANLQAWQQASVEQAARLQQPEKAMNIDWDEVAKRGSELNSEKYANFVLPPQKIPAPEPAPAAPVEPEMPPMPAQPQQAVPPMPPMTSEEAMAAIDTNQPAGV